MNKSKLEQNCHASALLAGIQLLIEVTMDASLKHAGMTRLKPLVGEVDARGAKAAGIEVTHELSPLDE